jgi:hypothetical protein
VATYIAAVGVCWSSFREDGARCTVTTNWGRAGLGVDTALQVPTTRSGDTSPLFLTTNKKENTR